MTTMASAMASGNTRKIGDKSYEFRPLTLKDFGYLQKQALEEFKKERIKTYANNLALFPESERGKIIREVVDQVSKMSEADLPPQKMMIDAEGSVTLDESKRVKTDFVEYAHWWVSFSYVGRLHAVWLSMRKAQPELTLDQVESLLLDTNESVENLANVVGDLSSPKLGNGQPAPVEKRGRSRSTGLASSTPSA